MTKAGKTISSELAINYRLGLGADDKPFPSLKSKTIQRRRRLATVNKTDQRFRPAFSNITFGGDFVRSRRLSHQKNGVFIYKFTGQHIGYKGIRGKQSKPSSNSEIAKNLSDLGYKLAGVPLKARQRILKQFQRYLRRQLK